MSESNPSDAEITGVLKTLDWIADSKTSVEDVGPFCREAASLLRALQQEREALQKRVKALEDGLIEETALTVIARRDLHEALHLLRQARKSRATDHADAAYSGWARRTDAFLNGRNAK